MSEATTPTVVTRQCPPYGLGSTRVLVLGWCLWLLGAWGVVLWTDSPVPAARWMVFSAVIGLMAIWPAWRLSVGGESGALGSGRGEMLGQTLMDWACLIVVLQAVIWPLRLTAGWSLAQTWWLGASVAAWSGLTGLVIAWARGRLAACGASSEGDSGCDSGCDSGGGGIVAGVAMAVCLALLLIEPVLMWLLNGSWAMRVSPIETVWALSVPPARYRPDPWTTRVMVAAIAAGVGWIALALWTWVGAKASAKASEP